MINDDIADAAVRHSVFLGRYGGSTAKRIVGILADADRDLTKRLAERIDRLGPIDRQAAGQGGVTSRRLKKLRDEVREQSKDLRNTLLATHKSELRELVDVEIEIASKRLQESIGIDLKIFRPEPELLRAIVEGRAMRGRTLSQWWTDLSARRFLQIDSAFRLGLIEGDTTPQIMRRVRDGLGVSQRSADTLVRTSINATANQARDLLYQANSDVIEKWEFLAVLDSRTSAVCAGLSGQMFPVGEGPFPPRHPRCRSVSVPVVKSWRALAKDGALKRGRGSTNIDTLFTQRLKARGLSDDAIKGTKRRTQASMNGQVAGDLNYGQWLRRQPKPFIEDVLGPTKAKLFVDGELDVDKFVDLKTSRPFTLDQLRQRESAAWMRAGLGS
jgi:SPP1 gp7 family putative phage head morphogenesis protein